MNPCTQSRTASNRSPEASQEDEPAEPAATDSWLKVSSTNRLRVPTRTNTPSTTLAATDPRASARLCFLKTG